MRTGSLRDEIPAALPEESFTPIAGGDGCRVERIVSRGHASPDGFWYDQDETELVLVVEGAAVLEFDAPGGHPPDRVTLGPGDWCEIPAHERHRVAWTAPDRDTIWVAVFWPGGQTASR